MTEHHGQQGAPFGAPPRLPTVAALRGILLGLGHDPGELDVSAEPIERQQTVLASLAATYLLALLNNHVATVDRLSEDERYEHAVGPIVHLTGDDSRSMLAFADFFAKWAGYLVGEATSFDPDGKVTPRLAILEALAAVLVLVEHYDRAHDAPVVDFGNGDAGHLVDGAELVAAQQHLAAAAFALGRLLGPSGTVGE